MIYSNEYVVGPNIRQGFEGLVTTYGMAITHIQPDGYTHGRNTKYTIEGTDEEDFAKFHQDLDYLYKIASL